MCCCLFVFVKLNTVYYKLVRLYVFMAMLCKIYNNNIHKEESFFLWIQYIRFLLIILDLSEGKEIRKVCNRMRENSCYYWTLFQYVTWRDSYALYLMWPFMPGLIIIYIYTVYLLLRGLKKKVRLINDGP